MESVASTATFLCRWFAAWTFASKHYLIRRKWPKRQPLGGPPRRLWWWGGTRSSWRSVCAGARRQDGAVSETRLRHAPKDRSCVFAMEHDVERAKHEGGAGVFGLA